MTHRHTDGRMDRQKQITSVPLHNIFFAYMWGWRRETLQTLPFHFVKDNFFDESIFWKKLNPFYRSFASNSGWDIRSSYSQARNADTVGKKWKISLWFFWGATRKPKNSYKTVEEETWKYCLTQQILLIIIFFLI